ncbi:adenylate/guanylate cyclase domain-containing protein [Saccharicrinis carchari]|nr:adenylate/guanylate cyclase domain-containing protein [Saccharicrinis carchari]
MINSIVLSGDTLNRPSVLDTVCAVESKLDFVEFNFVPAHPDSAELRRFYLKGHDATFGKWTYKNSVTYSNLEKGNYQFILESEKGVQTIYLYIAPSLNGYLVSTVILLLVAVTGLLLLKIGFKKGAKRKLFPFHRDSIAPLLQKYLNQPTTETAEYRKLAQRRSIKYEKATVLFADIQGFTKIVEHMNPETLIDELDRFFVHFDEVAEKYKIEKIKTIGDAYMCAGGLPEKNRTNPIEVVMAAIEMQQFMQKTGEEAQKDGKDFWELRIGIHTGSVISGVIGRKKLSFDIWGDTVNIASRMESSGVAGKINVSGVSYQLIKDFFVCEYRGKMPIKYKGETDMYFVKGIMPHLSDGELGKRPNEEFFTKLQWIRYDDIEEVVLTKMKTELPASVTYHNIQHTIDVCTQVEVLGRAEGLSSKNLLLVKTAALFHDTGFMVNPQHHEVQSVRIVREMLPHYGFRKNEIETISQLIMATESNAEPNNLMEMVLKDADLDYLGRADFVPLSLKLWEELCEHNGKMSQKEWNKKQFAFLSKHVYYTATAKKMRQVNKKMQLKKIERLLK